MIAVEGRGNHEMLVRAHVGSFVHLGALLVLRTHGPQFPEEIAAQVGISASEVAEALQELATSGLVERAGRRGSPRFLLTTQPRLRAAVESLLHRYEEDRHFRTCLVLDILRRMSTETFAPSQA